MTDITLISTSPSGMNSILTENSSPERDRQAKSGRPNRWTASRQRKLARLYLYSILPPKDIPQALREDDWIPGKDSTTKIVNSLLDNQPRWLRPKNREEMERRIEALSQCRATRKRNRNLSDLDVNDQIKSCAARDVVQYTEFTETPLEDLIGFTPEDWPLSPAEPGTANMVSSTSLSISLSELAVVSLQEDRSRTLVPPMLSLNYRYDEDVRTHTEILQIDKLPVDQQSLSTYMSTSSLRSRLSKYSNSYLKAIKRLLKSHSIAGSSASTIKGPSYSASEREEDRSSVDGLTTGAASFIQASSSAIAVAMPNSFLTIDEALKMQGICMPGLKPHDLKTCWCAVVEELQFKSQLWVSERRLLSHGDDPPTNLTNLDFNFKDDFGNTVLRFLAARGP